MFLFLDIDGVMVPAKGWKAPEFLADGFPAYSSESIVVLQQILTPDTVVVLTSSHKGNFTLNEWKQIFRRRNIYIDKLEKLEVNTRNQKRIDELMEWFSNNPFDEKFIIIDDDKSLNELPLFFRSRLLQTNSHIGLTRAHMPLIKRIFEEED